MSTKLKSLYIDGEKYYTGFSFDIDDFIGDGVWWFQIYDGNRNFVYEEPFASSMGIIDKSMVKKIIKERLISLKGELLRETSTFASIRLKTKYAQI